MLIKGEKYACEACVRGHRVSNCQHSDRPLQHINKKVCQWFLNCFSLLRFAVLTLVLRAVRFHNAHIAEPFARAGLHMFVVNVVRRRMPRVLVRKMIHRVSLFRNLRGTSATVSDLRYSRWLLLQPWWALLVLIKKGALRPSSRIGLWRSRTSLGSNTWYSQASSAYRGRTHYIHQRTPQTRSQV